MTTKIPKWLTLYEQAEAALPLPLRNSDGTIIAAITNPPRVSVQNCQYLTVDDATQLRDWLTKVLS